MSKTMMTRMRSEWATAYILGITDGKYTAQANLARMTCWRLIRPRNCSPRFSGTIPAVRALIFAVRNRKGPRPDP
jgi:hypothetical protein